MGQPAVRFWDPPDSFLAGPGERLFGYLQPEAVPTQRWEESTSFREKSLRPFGLFHCRLATPGSIKVHLTLISVPWAMAAQRLLGN